VFGVTSIDDELFLLLNQDDNQVAVYSINDYRLLRHLNMPGLPAWFENDMTSCVHNKCLYIFGPRRSCILRYDLSSRVSPKKSPPTTKLLLPGSLRGLSVTPGHNLLVTYGDTSNKLVEFSTDSGQCVREITVTLQSDIRDLCHAVQLTTGQFVICHGGENDRLHRVCLVDDKGKVTRSYGGQSGSDVRQLYYPCHLAVDDDTQFVLVADDFNKRVVMLSPTLEFVRYFREKMRYHPQRLYFHHTTRRLYVGQEWTSDVTVIQL